MYWEMIEIIDELGTKIEMLRRFKAQLESVNKIKTKLEFVSLPEKTYWKTTRSNDPDIIYFVELTIKMEPGRNFINKYVKVVYNIITISKINSHCSNDWNSDDYDELDIVIDNGKLVKLQGWCSFGEFEVLSEEEWLNAVNLRSELKNMQFQFELDREDSVKNFIKNNNL